MYFLLKPAFLFSLLIITRFESLSFLFSTQILGQSYCRKCRWSCSRTAWCQLGKVSFLFCIFRWLVLWSFNCSPVSSIQHYHLECVILSCYWRIWSFWLYLKDILELLRYETFKVWKSIHFGVYHKVLHTYFSFANTFYFFLLYPTLSLAHFSLYLLKKIYSTFSDFLNMSMSIPIVKLVMGRRKYF